jgi:hypothetical protein
MEIGGRLRDGPTIQTKRDDGEGGEREGETGDDLEEGNVDFVGHGYLPPSMTLHAVY